MQVAVRHELGHDAQVASVHTRAKQLGENGGGRKKREKKRENNNKKKSALPSKRLEGLHKPLHRRGFFFPPSVKPIAALLIKRLGFSLVSVDRDLSPCSFSAGFTAHTQATEKKKNFSPCRCEGGESDGGRRSR
jgi:hypothetical protein